MLPKTVWGLFLSLQIHSLEVKSQRFKRLTQRLINRNLLRTQFLRNVALRNLSLHNLELHGFIERNKTPKRFSLDHLDSFKVVELVLGFPEGEALRGGTGQEEGRFKPPSIFHTDRSKAVLLLWFLTVTCSWCLYLCFGSAIILVTYCVNFR